MANVFPITRVPTRLLIFLYQDPTTVGCFAIQPRVFHEIANEVPSNSSRHSKSKHTPFHGANISTFLRANLPRDTSEEACFSTVLTISRLIQLQRSFPVFSRDMLNSWVTCAAGMYKFMFKLCTYVS